MVRRRTVVNFSQSNWNTCFCYTVSTFEVLKMKFMRMDVKMLWLMLLLVSCAQINGFCNDSESVFLAHPADLTVKEGENALFSCTLSESNPETDTITWISSPPLPYNAMAINFDRRTKHLTSRIGFANVNKHSNSTHTCIASIVNSQNQYTTCLSKEAKLNVLYFPRKEELYCSPSTVPNLQGNGTILMRCEVSQGNPAVDMAWYLDGTSIFQSSTYFIDNNTQVLLQNIQYDQSLQNKTITCLVTSEKHFPDEQIKCTIGPFMVLDKARFHGNTSDGNLQTLDAVIQNTTNIGEIIQELNTNLPSQTELGEYKDITTIKNVRYIEGHARARGLDRKTYIYIAATGICILGFIAIVISFSAAKILISQGNSQKDTVITKSSKVSKLADPGNFDGCDRREMTEPIYEEAPNPSSLPSNKQQETKNEVSHYDCDIFKTGSPSDICSCSSCASHSSPSSEISDGDFSQYASVQSLGDIQDGGISYLYDNREIIQMHDIRKSYAKSSFKMQPNFPLPPPLPQKDSK